MSAPSPHAPDRDGEILVIGSANMDVTMRVDARPAPGETVLARDAVLRAGGKGANQAVAAAATGARVRMAGLVGADAHAETIRESLGRAGVETSLLAATGRRSTGLAVVLVSGDGENAIAVSPGANHAMATQDVDRLRADVARAGLLLLQMELPVDVVGRAVEVAAEERTPVMLNLAPAADVPAALLDAVAVLVVNRSEAAQLLGAELADGPALLRAAAGLRTLGAAAVVITAGADGAVVGDADGATDLRAVPADVVDTTGAGDAFVGVLAAHIARGRPLRAAVRPALAAGAAAVGLEGAQLTGELPPLIHLDTMIP